MNCKFWLFILFIAFACAQPSSPKTSAEKTPVPVVDYLPENGFDAIDIPFNFFALRVLSLPDYTGQLDSIEVLKALFPGHFFEKYYDTEVRNIVAWQCPACPKIPFETGFYEDGNPVMDSLPYNTLGNYTSLIKSFYYQEAGQSKAAFFFNTSSDYKGSGRFTFGVLSAAVFVLEHQQWQLKVFTPVVCSEGKYNTAEAPQNLFTVGPYHFFELQGGFANAQGASNICQGIHLFSIHEGQVKRVFYDVYADCNTQQDSLVYWKSYTYFVENIERTLPDMLINTIGYYKGHNKKDQFLQENIAWWPQVMHLLEKENKEEFTVIRHFVFSQKSGYMLADLDVE